MSGDFLGQVIYNEDPTFSGRCKVRVFGIFDDLPDENVPWFVPVTSCVFSSGGAGSISIPKVGDIVRVNFMNDDYYSGEYRCIQNIDPNLINEIKDDYQNTHVLLYDGDQDLIVIYQPKTGYKMYLNGSYIKIDADGTIQLTHKNNANVIEITNDTITIVSGNSSNINILTDSDVTVKGDNVHVNSSNVVLGTNGGTNTHAVLGEELIAVLQAMVASIDIKYPQGSALTGRDFHEILSNQVKLT